MGIQANPLNEVGLSEAVTEVDLSEAVTVVEPFVGPVIAGLIVLSVFLSVLVCFYAKTLNRRPLIWFMISFGSSILTVFVPLGPMICFGMLVYKGRLPSKEELEELDFLVQDFLSLYEDKKDLAAKHVVMRNLYFRVNKDRSKTNKWEITNALNTLVSL
ncbi:uncharacterized protein METZ01_LOCUS385176 [marine metagenome]|uniref:Uncharacterized protein n=1 Tax=marine metagenome TaxID=408172 RepID=A0A382UDZ7_9ZZZZ